MSQPTSERLALAMEQAGCSSEMIAMARDGYYDDFRSPLPSPQMQLVADLNAAGQFELSTKVISGEFDATRDEAQEWYQSEGRHIMEHLG